MSGFYGGTNNDSSNNNVDNNEIINKDILQHLINEESYHRSVTDASSTSNIIVGIFVLLLGGTFTFLLLYNSKESKSFSAIIAIILIVCFGGLGLSLIGIGLDRKKKERIEIQNLINENKDALKDFCNSIEKDNLPKIIKESYELKPNRVKTRFFRFAGYTLIGLGILFFFVFNKTQVNATITSKTESSETVEYSFSYEAIF
jgi:hypothetical protein